MRLMLVAVSSNAQLSGVTRHVANLTRCLLLHSGIEEIHLIAAPWEHQLLRDAIAVEDPRLHIHCVHLDRFPLGRNLWLYFDLPAIACQLKADVVHLSYPVPVNRRKLPCPAIVTVHDLYPWDIPENFGFPKVLFNRLILQQCLRAADALACVSEATIDRLRDREGAKVTAKAVRIYNCVESSRARTGRSPLPGSMNAPFLLCVAQHRRNKNIGLALGALARLLREEAVHPEMQLVVVGIPGPETPSIQRWIETQAAGRNVALLSGISEAELQWCYRNCEALLAPSLMEGFGLPVAEGLLAGCRIVCSDIAPFRELGGEHCRYFALGENAEEAFAGAIRAALKEHRSGPVSLPQLSGKTIAAEYMALYGRVMERAESSSRVTQASEDLRPSEGAG
jgi:glycosyltransferase involved in cell wall biosynthesis